MATSIKSLRHPSPLCQWPSVNYAFPLVVIEDHGQASPKLKSHLTCAVSSTRTKTWTAMSSLRKMMMTSILVVDRANSHHGYFSSHQVLTPLLFSSSNLFPPHKRFPSPYYPY